MVLDENECLSADLNNCDSETTDCVNWATGFRCQCKPGFKAIDGSDTTCEGKP